MSDAGEAEHEEDPQVKRKMLFQLLSARGCFSEDELLEILPKATGEEFTSESLLALLRSVNDSVKPFGFEVRTLIVTDRRTNARQKYHGLINIEEDYAAKEHGSSFTPEELKEFTAVIDKLLWNTSMTTGEVTEICSAASGKRLKESEVQVIVSRWEDQHWLSREQRNYLIIGPRTYLELRSLLDHLLENPLNEEDADMTEEAREEAVNRIKQSFPQSILL